MIVGIEAAHANKTERTGVEEYCFEIIQHLKKIIPAEVRVILYSKEPLRGELADLPANWSVKILAWPFSKLWSQVRLSLELLFHPPDIFFAPGQLLPFFTPRRTVTMLHDSAFLVYPGAYRFWGRQYLKWMNRRVVKNSALILTSSNFNKKELQCFYGNVAVNKTTVVPLAAAPLPAAEVDPKKFGITKPFLFSVGRLETKKNTGALVRAFSLLRATANMQLVLAGRPGAGYREVERAIKESPFKQDIIVLGYVARPELAGLLGRAAAFVFPSLYEGFGLPVLEAMMLGVPVVAGDIPALREVGGEAAAYVDPADVGGLSATIAAVLANPEPFRNAGPERAKLFSWEITARESWAAMTGLQ